MNQSLGILGGLGPLASAEFLKTIYEFNITASEQEAPTCILFSDPTFPDRTDAILRGEDEILLNLLVKSLENLCHLGVSRIVLACITMHYLLPKVPSTLREKVISLIDLIIQEVLETKELHLLLCTNGARQTGIFQQHEHWTSIEQYVLLPDEEDQNILQDCIYQIKVNQIQDTMLEYFDALVGKYRVAALIAGCTEFHLVKKHLMRPEYSQRGNSLVDPLLIIAKNLETLMKIDTP